MAKKADLESKAIVSALKLLYCMRVFYVSLNNLPRYNIYKYYFKLKI